MQSLIQGSSCLLGKQTLRDTLEKLVLLANVWVSKKPVKALS